VKCEIEHLGKNKESRNLRKITLKKDIFKLNVSKCPEVYRGVWAGFRSCKVCDILKNFPSLTHF
jgi:hypothetical protein